MTKAEEWFGPQLTGVQEQIIAPITFYWNNNLNWKLNPSSQFILSLDSQNAEFADGNGNGCLLPILMYFYCFMDSAHGAQPQRACESISHC